MYWLHFTHSWSYGPTLETMNESHSMPTTIWRVKHLPTKKEKAEHDHHRHQFQCLIIKVSSGVYIIPSNGQKVNGTRTDSGQLPARQSRVVLLLRQNIFAFNCWIGPNRLNEQCLVYSGFRFNLSVSIQIIRSDRLIERPPLV